MDRATVVLLAKLSEKSERFEEMVQHMKAIANMPQELTAEERNLLSVAYKNVIGARRSAWRVLCQIADTAEPDTLAVIAQYKARVEGELEAICGDVVLILSQCLIPNLRPETGAVSLAFYKKMMGDYWRYLAEVRADARHQEACLQAMECYKQAAEHAVLLNPANPIRLGLALNFSVFHFENMHSAEHARELAHNAFTQAIDHLQTLEPDEYKDATLIMQLLKENLEFWAVDEQQAMGMT